MANGTYHTPKGHRAVQVYTPTVGLYKDPTDETKIPKEEKIKIRSRLRTAMVTNHDDYRILMSYLHQKFPLEIDGLVGEDKKSNVSIQWNYRAGLNKEFNIHDDVLNEDYPVYAFVIYDPERDNEPLLVGGSFFEEVPNNGLLENGPKKIVVGQGLVLFADPSIRCGLGGVAWDAEAALYRELGIHFQKDIQNEFSLKTTLDMFKNKDSIKILSEGRLKNDGTRAGIRILMDYFDEQLIEDWEEEKDSAPMFDYHHKYDVDHLLEREGFTREELLEPWNK